SLTLVLRHTDQRSCPLFPRKRTCAVHRLMSALGQKRTFCLFDHLICTKNESGRDCKPKGLRCFCVHGQFKPGWLLNGQIAWLGSVQDLGNVSHRSAIHVWKAWAVCDQTTRGRNDNASRDVSEGGLNPCRPNLADRKCWSARLPPVRASCGRLPISNAILGSSTYFPLYPKKWKALKHPQRPKVLCSATNQANVRFGSKADMCGALGHVRFTPYTDRESGFLQKVMSALPPKADMCSATRDVR